MNEHVTHLTYSAFSEDWSFSIEAKYASMRTLPDPFGIPGPSFMPSLSARTLPKFYPPDFGSHTMRVQTLQVGGWHPMRANQMAKNSPASPRVVRRGTARPAEKSFHSASFEAKHRNSTTIRRAGQSRIAFRSVPRDADDCNSTVPSCVFFLPEHTESGFAGHRRRLGKDAAPAPMLQPQPCHRGRVPSRPLASPHVHFSHRSGIGPARDVPAPPSARDVRTGDIARQAYIIKKVVFCP